MRRSTTIRALVLVAASLLATAATSSPRDHRGGAPGPLVVQVQGAETAQERAADHLEDQRRHHTDQAWTIGLGVAAILAALAQFAVLGFQIIYLRRTVRDGERSIEAATAAAQAATLQARVMLATQNSEVLVSAIQLVPYPDAPPGQPDPIIAPGPLATPEMRITLLVSNVGKSRSALRKMCVEWLVVPRTSADENPDPPTSPAYTNDVGIGHVLEPDRNESMKWSGEVNSVVRLTPDQLNAINTNDAWLWVYGKIDAADLLKDVYEMGFAGHWEAVAGGTIGTSVIPVARGFVLEGPPPYIYRRKVGS